MNKKLQQIVLRHSYTQDNYVNKFNQYDTLMERISRTSYGGRVTRKYYLESSKTMTSRELSKTQFQLALNHLFSVGATRTEFEAL